MVHCLPGLLSIAAFVLSLRCPEYEKNVSPTPQIRVRSNCASVMVLCVRQGTDFAKLDCCISSYSIYPYLWLCSFRNQTRQLSESESTSAGDKQANDCYIYIELYYHSQHNHIFPIYPPNRLSRNETQLGKPVKIGKIQNLLRENGVEFLCYNIN